MRFTHWPSVEEWSFKVAKSRKLQMLQTWNTEHGRSLVLYTMQELLGNFIERIVLQVEPGDEDPGHAQVSFVVKSNEYTHNEDICYSTVQGALRATIMHLFCADEVQQGYGLGVKELLEKRRKG